MKTPLTKHNLSAICEHPEPDGKFLKGQYFEFINKLTWGVINIGPPMDNYLILATQWSCLPADLWMRDKGH